ncbi:MAG: cobalamin B12-binding domain-containing protein [Acidobacteria bacterium]|nr:cobalamin B12-binding domain-containing protein [Acidobacteriota bacterium]
MKILLVRAKPTFMDMILGIPIGLAYCAAVAETAGHEVDILDLALEKNVESSHARLRDHVKTKKYDLAGLTCMTVEYPGAVETAKVIKDCDPSLRIVFGGQHPTIESDEVINNGMCDFVVVGEGEDTFVELLHVLQTGADPWDVPGILFHKNGSPLRSMPRSQTVDIDALPWPAYHLLEVERYFQVESARYTPKHKRAIQIFTSRGCPWRCTYCHDLFGKQFRGRSAANVFGEMQMLYRTYGVREYMIEDDIFNLDIPRAKKICDLITNSEMDGSVYMQFGNGLRLECFDEELVRKLAQAGTHHIAIAIESASPRIQKLIKKNLHLNKAADVLGWTRKYGISTLGFFMIGFPTETVEEIKQTIEFARKTDLDEALFSIVIPYAGTEINKMIYEQGLYDPDEVARHGKKVVTIKSEHFDFFTLKKLQQRAYLSFFLSKGRFLRMLPKLINLSSSRKYLKAIERNFLCYGGDATSRVN